MILAAAVLLSHGTVGPIDRPADLNVTLDRIGAPGALSLASAGGTAGTVLFFLNEQCGVTFYYRSRLQKLQADFAPRFGFVGVRTGARQFPDRPLDLPEVRTLAMPFVDDRQGIFMDRFGVGQSLTFAVVDRQGILRYLGGFDDHVKEAGAKRSYLRDALRDVAAGRSVARKTAPAIGCAMIPMRRSPKTNEEPPR